MLHVEGSPSTVKPPKKCQRKVLKRNPLWKKIDKRDSIPKEPEFSNEQEVVNPEEQVMTPFQFFSKFIDKEFLNYIVDQSNLYSVQKNANKPLKLTVDEFEQWLGLSLWFSLHKLEDTRLHWSDDFKDDRCTGLMSRSRWEEIKSNLHFVDNNNLGDDDRVAKVRPFVDHLRSKFKEIPMTRDLCIDETIIPFKGHSLIKQYIPKKPYKWGFKLFVLADKHGMVHDFIPYVGKIEPVNDQDVPDLGASANIVLHLAENIPINKGYRLYFDNWFNSLNLQLFLAERKIWCCGTVQPRRISGLKCTEDKEMQKKGRGTYEEWDANVNGQRATLVKWFDNKPVHVLSTFATAQPETQKERYDRRSKSKINISCPNIVDKYNKAMGGVDLHDQMISLYRFSFKSKKYYHRIIWHLFDMAIVNAWFLYRRACSDLHIPVKKQNKLATFKARIAKALMHSGKLAKKRGRPSNDDVTMQPKKKRIVNQGLPLPEDDIRFDNLGHLPKVGKVRHMCKNAGCKSRIVTYCQKCEVYLCISDKRNCYEEFHSAQ